MSNLVTCLNALIPRHHPNASALANKMGIAPIMLSRHLSGKRDPSHETLRLLIKHAATTPDEAREILRAHLLDEIERLDAATLATLHLGDARESPEDARRTDQLLKIIANVKEAAELAKMIVELAENSGTLGRQALHGLPEPIPYPAHHDEPLGHVAEDPPATSKKKPPVSKK